MTVDLFLLAGAEFDQALAAALRALREARGWRTVDAARVLGLDKRSYERIEAGRTAITLDRLMRFAEAAEGDPVAVLLAAIVRQPRLAASAARNKLGLAQAMALGRFVRERGDQIADLDVATIMAAAAQMYAQLAEHLDRRHALLDALSDGADVDPERTADE